MHVKTLFLLACALIVMAAVGCSSIKIAGVPLGGSEPTVAPSRTPRPTFTPRPVATDTPSPTNTLAPTATSIPATLAVPATSVPPTRTATKPAPTKAPATATNPPLPSPTPLPTKIPYQYSFAGSKCEHSGGTYLEVYVYQNADLTGPIQGVRVRASWAPDGPPVPDDQTTRDDGKAQYTLASDGAPIKTGTWWAWVVDSKGNRISDMSNSQTTADKGVDNPGDCWKAKFAFYVTK